MAQDTTHADLRAPRQPALLVVGPTGSGKTPLGALLDERGLNGTRCAHFDFGANLREAVRKGPGGLFGSDDIAFLSDVLRTGALLENEHFAIAERVLKSFLAERAVDEKTLVVLNGLPRHAGQAEALDGMIDVRAVVRLECSAEDVPARIRSNIGGDRGDRLDDDPTAVRKKLELYHARTAPLIDWYRLRGSRIETVNVTATTTPELAWESLRSLGSPFE